MTDKTYVLNSFPEAYIKWDILYSVHGNSRELNTVMGGDIIGYGIFESEAWMYARTWVDNNITT